MKTQTQKKYVAYRFKYLLVEGREEYGDWELIQGAYPLELDAEDIKLSDARGSGEGVLYARSLKHLKKLLLAWLAICGEHEKKL